MVEKLSQFIIGINNRQRKYREIVLIETFSETNKAKSWGAGDKSHLTLKFRFQFYFLDHYISYKLREEN